jgi:energy-coupling factor transporter ATP-binding protein EcfA2
MTTTTTATTNAKAHLLQCGERQMCVPVIREEVSFDVRALHSRATRVDHRIARAQQRQACEHIEREEVVHSE